MNETNGDKNWKTGELEFECLMRALDNAGYRTGYVYRQPCIRTADNTITFKDDEMLAATLSTSSFAQDDV
jgi:hypothetical protein